MYPWAKLDCMPVCGGVPIGGISLRTNLNLLLKAEIRRGRNCPARSWRKPGTGLTVCPARTDTAKKANMTADARDWIRWRAGARACNRADEDSGPARKAQYCSSLAPGGSAKLACRPPCRMQRQRLRPDRLSQCRLIGAITHQANHFQAVSKETLLFHGGSIQ